VVEANNVMQMFRLRVALPCMSGGGSGMGRRETELDVQAVYQSSKIVIKSLFCTEIYALYAYVSSMLRIIADVSQFLHIANLP
jgi:hypothetical protein